MEALIIVAAIVGAIMLATKKEPANRQLPANTVTQPKPAGDNWFTNLFGQDLPTDVGTWTGLGTTGGALIGGAAGGIGGGFAGAGIGGTPTAGIGAIPGWMVGAAGGAVAGGTAGAATGGALGALLGPSVASIWNNVNDTLHF